MPKASFFQSLGLFAVESFLEPKLCHGIHSAMCDSETASATIYKDGEEGVLDEEIRRVLDVKIPRGLARLVRQRFVNLIPRLEEYFQVPLRGYQGPNFLRYGAGAFYHPHLDESDDVPTSIAKRRVSAVLFLNAQSTASPEEPQTFRGGSLVFYGLMSGPEWGKCKLPLEPEAGLLIAFRSNLLHEVEPVLSGERFTVVGWYTAE